VTESPGILLTIAAFLLLLGPLVFVHELGHYLAGRWFGVKAEVFSIGFGREVLGWTDGQGTRWKVAWLPLGGYVKFAGDMNAGSQPDPAWLALPPAERAKTFQAKPLWQRAVIVAAGPAINLALAVLILAGFALAYGDPRPIVGQVVAGSAAERAGLVSGDIVRRVQGQRIERFNEIVALVAPRPGEDVVIEVERAGALLAKPAKLGSVVTRSASGEVRRVGQLGFGRQSVSLIEAPVFGAQQTGQLIGMMADLLGQMVTGSRSVKELGGPLRIAQVSGGALSLGWPEFVSLVALISINLGFINLLPVPMLDGGHLMFYAIEAVRRKPVGAQAQEWAYRGGLAAILALMLVVTINDLSAFGVWRGLAGLIG
jgi:regulator of sigma E protease